ncbi:hypothetical protein [Hymenobacter volaticus]|uniref:Uncharacterized protein n=1 Tax=Hymenobacter volaticus TaxID=2932254 RepID=A0ABY4G1C4_9BACT|nr:hypothetical protein [Hymenobacter volaticus]UOQ64665.1 hypothetical protein MUN86_13905 [Hymenobacter volaticus]
MRPELKRLQQIEQHLLGDPQPGQAEEWALQQLLDADLEADTEAQRRVYQGLYVAGQRQLRRELEAIHERLYGPRPGRWSQLATAGLRAIRNGWWRFPRNH